MSIVNNTVLYKQNMLRNYNRNLLIKNKKKKKKTSMLIN